MVREASSSPLCLSRSSLNVKPVFEIQQHRPQRNVIGNAGTELVAQSPWGWDSAVFRRI